MSVSSVPTAVLSSANTVCCGEDKYCPHCVYEFECIVLGNAAVGTAAIGTTAATAATVVANARTA